MRRDARGIPKPLASRHRRRQAAERSEQRKRVEARNAGSEHRDRQAYRAGWDRIFGGSTEAKVVRSGHYVWDAEAGELRHVNDLTAEQLHAARANARKRDSKQFVSNALGCHPDQVGEFNRRFGCIDGVRYLPGGKCRLRDRKAKLALMKARGMIDHDEVRGGRSR